MHHKWSSTLPFALSNLLSGWLRNTYKKNKRDRGQISRSSVLVSNTVIRIHGEDSFLYHYYETINITNCYVRFHNVLISIFLSFFFQRSLYKQISIMELECTYTYFESISTNECSKQIISSCSQNFIYIMFEVLYIKL